MSEPINDGGPAFPIPDTLHANGQVQYGANGMSLRDWFAGQALANYALQYQEKLTGEDIASQCYSLADAMLAAREKGKE